MIELRDELYAMPMQEWRYVPIEQSHHKWWLKMYRIGDDGQFYFCFESPQGRRYSFWTEIGKNGHGRVTDAEVARANSETIASYCEPWGDTANMDAVIRLTPRHILDRLHMLLDAIR